jgi:glycerophosphoryl diester phosphodiesterase
MPRHWSFLGWLACVFPFVAAAPAARAAESGGNATLWTFAQPADRLGRSSGTATLDYFDPAGTGWGPAATSFGKASSFGLPPMTGGDPDVMHFPACSRRQGYRLQHGSSPNGPFGKTHSVVSNYTLIFDVLYPLASDGQRRPLVQTNVDNANDAEFYVLNAPSGGVGTTGIYRGSIRPNTWHRVAIVVQSAPDEGKAQYFVDGRFAGGTGTTGSGLGIGWTLGPTTLLFTDSDGQAAGGFLSSLYFVDRAMSMEAIRALGGPHAAGALTPGESALPFEQRLPETVNAIGHRGGFFCCAPDNTMAGIRRAISHGIPVIEIDTRLSSDGVGVLIHDPTVDRTTSASGEVASFTAAQLNALDAGSWFGPEFSSERVPTLVDAMTEAKGRLVLYFDLKINGQIDAIVRALEETGFDPADCWFWTYGDAGEADVIRSRIANAKIISSDPPANWASLQDFFPSMRAAGVYGFDLGIAFVDAQPTFVRAAQSAGFIVAVHTILDPDSMSRYAALGVDFIETDFPQIVQELRRRP